MLRDSTKATDVKDVLLLVKVLDRRARLCFCPAFIMDYTFSESYANNGEIVADRYLALMGGTYEGNMQGERHYCPRKAQITAGGFGVSLGVTAAALGQNALGAGHVLVEICFWTFMASSLAG